MQVLRKILVFTLVVNVFFLPIYSYFIFENFNVIIYQNDYKLKKVEIKKIIDLSYNDENSSYEAYRATYTLFDNKKYTKDSIDVAKGSTQFNHFMNAGESDEIFGGNSPAKVNDSIWVWHNKSATDFYALGENDTFKTNTYWVGAISLIILCLLALWSIQYHIKEKKNKKTT